jgi:hypothetical protein
MTALSLQAIPSNINTYERLLVWAAQCCQSISNGEQVNVERNAGQVPQVQVAVGITADNVPRLIVSAYLEVDYDALNSGNQKTWMATKDISNAVPHTNLTTN